MRKEARRTVILLSLAYPGDNRADFENTLAQTMGIQQGTYPLVPVKIAPLGDNELPMRLAMLTPVDVTQPERAERAMTRLVEALKGEVPRR